MRSSVVEITLYVYTNIRCEVNILPLFSSISKNNIFCVNFFFRRLTAYPLHRHASFNFVCQAIQALRRLLSDSDMQLITAVRLISIITCWLEMLWRRMWMMMKSFKEILSNIFNHLFYTVQRETVFNLVPAFNKRTLTEAVFLDISPRRH